MNDYDSEQLQLGCSKFEQCKYRSVKPKIKKSCCSARKLEAYACSKRKIYPLSPTEHCLTCNDFISIYLD